MSIVRENSLKSWGYIRAQDMSSVADERSLLNLIPDVPAYRTSGI